MKIEKTELFLCHDTVFESLWQSNKQLSEKVKVWIHIFFIIKFMPKKSLIFLLFLKIKIDQSAKKKLMEKVKNSSMHSKQK
jgi:hypothetical protein